ncbi:hypothetical protein GYMLUDRAFT_397582 [Collybiopsis luxurians FD-317 M1]|uniref:Uncharacterized protein n=1 Tax=Collybiopsis luxurians FD-317 M1 TaxID=944289 RepID=A0A0D0BP02_9AGAR|nr:hypothetical protein GYMLUDRAFT_397582 [Collybiopsis luxurians FD-317 M1]
MYLSMFDTEGDHQGHASGRGQSSPSSTNRCRCLILSPSRSGSPPFFCVFGTYDVISNIWCFLFGGGVVCVVCFNERIINYFPFSIFPSFHAPYLICAQQTNKYRN